MGAPGKIALFLSGVALAGAVIASCTFDLGGLPGGTSGATTTGAGGVMTTSTATSTGGGGGSGGATSTATGTGGSGGATPVCGNAVQEGDEDCDDGNTEMGDGCSSLCAVEHLDGCPGLGIPLAPPGITLHGTLAAASNDLAPTCGTDAVDVVYEVTPTVSGTLKVTLAGMFEKSISVRSSCVGSVNVELDCGAGIGDLSLRRWVYAGVKYYVVVDAAAAQAFTLKLDLSACGDGVVQEFEECDNAGDPTCIGCFKCKGAGEILDPVSRHCYRRIGGQSKVWAAARKDCLFWGGDLVGVSSSAEADFLKASNFNDVWTGATDAVTECSYAWVNGEPWQPRWSGNEPNNSGGKENCALFFNNGLMDDRNCDENHESVCERAPGGKCNDGFVQPGEECDDALTYSKITCLGCVVQCPPGEIKDPATHHCYQIVTAPSDWVGAKAACAANGTYLAAVTSPVENELLKPMLPGPVWIGASRANPFLWANTDAFCYVNWNPSPPAAGGKDCATLLVDGSWITDTCTQKKAFLCERDN